jgi:hypothetical protein
MKRGQTMYKFTDNQKLQIKKCVDELKDELEEARNEYSQSVDTTIEYCIDEFENNKKPSIDDVKEYIDKEMNEYDILR